MQTELVEKRRWISQACFLHALNFCMLLPGPEAQQLAIYIGWLLHRTPGGIVAGALFVLPSMFILWGLSAVYAAYGNTPWIAAAFYGLKPAVMAIVAVAIIRIGRKALKNVMMWSVAALAFAGIYFFKIPFPAIIFAAGLIGFLGQQFWREKLVMASGGTPQRTVSAVRTDSADDIVLGDAEEIPRHARPSLRRGLRIAIVCLALWWTPVWLIGVWQGREHTLFQEGLFFSKAAVVTFGGAYAVLPYVAQQALDKYHWLQTGQMMDGLGLAETTPGPLIMVLQFVGFMGGWNKPGSLSPLTAGTLGALITTWVTFVPCFLWVFLGAPHIEQLRDNPKLNAALSTVTAAVVGVILNLAVWFGLHALFPPGKPIDWIAALVSIVAFVGMLRWRWGVIPVVFGSAIAGLIWKLAS